MYTSGYANRKAMVSATAVNQPQQSATGLISEVLYREDQPMMTQLLLLPLLQQLGQQDRWQLWLTPQQKLSRQWVQASGLPLSKVMQASQMLPGTTLDSMIRALRTGNYSVVIGWIAEELSEEDQHRLANAAEEGHAMGFIMRPVRTTSQPSRQFPGLKIHSNLYH
ncbi:SOS-induced cell division inhibitor SulA [Scandinavium sp. V105_16]|uniref:Cell division inhibitor SulA n=1 Tax=Scandinavium lactucae TaxID=3095028 RepID=A0AAJ2VU22_9ENTR|nr:MULTISPECIES: SOS-induced cell division inhibitor SulA [unclassified Scandinavium]MDX6022743.1 SOS-induced cell division inhibitor SulA [Scandinavium sp. V105_16]MDX6033415.1 SOS-induced cell division inhibitor SulA [Scandinavium sp. V105_12]MDX6042830.1 SOS-induced cell division inhibitor SulA [Scandinavium sp. V105_6]MDX6052831.1 SOS-induced cell division inhibitor SulA [Scandinavium sp. V105_1]